MDQRKQLREQFRADPLLMGKVLLPEMFRCESAGFHRTMVDDYMNPHEDRYCYIAPRGHAKSSISAVIALHHIEFAKHPQKYILLVSKTEKHAKNLLDTIKNILAGENSHDGKLGYYASFFGVRNKGISRKWTDSRIELPDRTIVEACGTGQQVVGLKKDSQRPTLIIFDDPEDMANTKTAESMDYNLKWMLNGLLPAKDPKGKIIIVGTPQHELCMVETVMKMKKWVTRRWQALHAEEGWEDDYTKINGCLWPEWMPIPRLIEEYEDYLSINKASSFYREYQCIVVGDGEKKFSAQMLSYYKLFEHKIVDNSLHLIHVQFAVFDPGKKEYVFGKKEWIAVRVQAGIDLASTITERSDFSVLYINGFSHDRRVFQLYVDRFKKPPLETVERLGQGLKKNKPHYVYVEQSGFQVMVRDTLQERGHYYPGMSKKIKPHDDKNERIYNKLQPNYGIKRVYHQIEGNAPKYEFHQKELFMFPRGKTDDSLDAESLSQEKIHWPDETESTDYVSKFSVNSTSEVEFEYHDENSWMTV